jgi:hypothetical protein
MRYQDGKEIKVHGYTWRRGVETGASERTFWSERGKFVLFPAETILW